MALVYSKQLLSGSANGRMVEVNTTASPGTTIHTVQATATVAREEVYLGFVNGATTDSQVTVEWGGTGTADQIVDTIPAQSGVRYVGPGWPFTGTSSIVRAFGTATGRLSAGGYVNRAT